MSKKSMTRLGWIASQSVCQLEAEADLVKGNKKLKKKIEGAIKVLERLGEAA